MKTNKPRDFFRSIIAFITSVSLLSFMPIIIEHMADDIFDFGTVAYAGHGGGASGGGSMGGGMGQGSMGGRMMPGSRNSSRSDHGLGNKAQSQDQMMDMTTAIDRGILSDRLHHASSDEDRQHIKDLYRDSQHDRQNMLTDEEFFQYRRRMERAQTESKQETIRNKYSDFAEQRLLMLDAQELNQMRSRLQNSPGEQQLQIRGEFRQRAMKRQQLLSADERETFRQQIHNAASEKEREKISQQQREIVLERAHLLESPPGHGE